VLLAYPKGHGSSDIQGFIFQNFPDGSPFHVVIASGWRHQRAPAAVVFFFYGETSDVFKMKQIPDLLGCNVSSVLNCKASPVCL